VRFGVSLHRTGTAAELADLARRLEDQGYDELQLADHLGFVAPFQALAVAATVTTRLGVATLVGNSNFWNPVLLAREAATLAMLSDGRFELGLGAGHAREEYEAAGIAYDRPSTRVDRLTESVAILRPLLAGERVTLHGAHHRAVDAATEIEHPPVPLLVGGNGDRVLALAAQEADAVGLTGFTSGTGQTHSDLSHFGWDGLAERIAHVRAAAGDRVDEPELQVLIQLVATGDRAQLAAENASGPFEQRAELLVDSPFVMIGSVDDHVEHCARLQEMGVARITAFDGRGADLLAPVIARLA
jgi:probable F420-dependent oxidoreductase